MKMELRVSSSAGMTRKQLRDCAKPGSASKGSAIIKTSLFMNTQITPMELVMLPHGYIRGKESF
jgi:hypothetical protein